MRWLTPEQFWSLTPVEFWLWVEATKQPKRYGAGKGAMTEAEVEALYAWTYGENPEDDS